jgi:ABC-2 type transport system permease protein
MSALSSRRLVALFRKETLQIFRDPSAMLIAFVLPTVMLFLFAYAVSLDISRLSIGLVLESTGQNARELAAGFTESRYFRVQNSHTRQGLTDGLVDGSLRGVVVIPQDFEQRLQNPGHGALVQILTDGSQPNTANFVASYSQGVVNAWLAGRPGALPPAITLEPRFWFNPELESCRALVPGAIAIIMTMIGTLLTAMVLAREWERGTMEAILSTPARVAEILLGKLLPYFVLGLVATVAAALLAVFVFGIPLRGSWTALLLMTACFLVPALGQGLLISAVAKNQFVAAQGALISGFLPAFLLSGFLFEIRSMPPVLQWLTQIVPARHFVSSLQTIFLTGDIWAILFPNLLKMLAIGSVFFLVALRKTRKTLDT